MEDHAISHFRILEKLGAGGMGEVHLAVDTRLQRRVALKRVTDSQAKSPVGRQRLRNEARMAAQLNHPHIAAIYDIIESGDQTYIVMEYVQGESLAARVKRGPIAVQEAVRIGIQVADALTDAHEHGVIHRDLKPANLIITPQASVKVLDFGLAKRSALAGSGDSSEEYTAEAVMTVTGVIAGTPSYMSPEQVLGKSADARSDIYSLGVVLFELLTGRRPFRSTDAMALGMAILTEDTPKVSDSNAAVPAALSAIVARAMARDPKDRYSSAAELKQALSLLQAADAPVPALLPRGEKPAAARYAALWGRIRQSKTARTAGITLLALLAVVYYWVHNGGKVPPNPPPRPPIVIVLPLSNLSGDPSKGYLGSGIAASLTNSLARLPGLGIIAGGVVDDYVRANGRNPSRIAKNLDATIVVDGAVQESGGTIRVTLNLIRPDGSIEWPHVEISAMSELFALQSRLAESVGTYLQSQLTDDTRRLLAKPLTDDLDAFQDYAHGLAFMERLDIPGNVELAIRSFESAIRRDPKFSAAHAELGEACWQQYLQTKDTQWVGKARDAVYEALRLDPDQPLVRLSLAQQLRGTGRLDDALAELRRVTEKKPNNDDAHRLAGQILASQGKFDEACIEFSEAIKLRPDYWRNHYTFGSACYNAGRLEDAARSFQRVTELQPTNAWGFLNLGNTYLRLGDLEQALANLEKSIAIEPDPYTYASVGTIHYWKGRYQDAAEAYEKAIKMLPNENWLHRNLGDAQARLGLKQQAITSYREAVRLSLEQLRVNSNDAEALGKLAVYQAKLGNRAEAVRRATQALKLLPDDPNVLYDNAVVHSLLGEKDRSIAMLKLAIQNGYSRFETKMDDDLAGLRLMPAFKDLVEGKQ